MWPELGDIKVVIVKLLQQRTFVVLFVGVIVGDIPQDNARTVGGA